MTAAAALQDAREAAHELGILAEPHRLLLLRQLRRGPRSAGFLAGALEISPSLASHHLAVLVEAGLLSRRQHGQYVCYTADRERVRELYERLGRLAGTTGRVGLAADRASRADPC